MNNVTITGRLTGEPKLKHTADERALCEMRVAVDNGNHPTTFIDVKAFDTQAYTCAEYLAKGRKVGVEGRLVMREWRDPDGKLHHRYSVIGRVEFLDPPPEREAEPYGGAELEPTGARGPELALAA